MLGKIECGNKQEQQDQMVGWHHQFNGYEFEQTQGDSEGQGSLICCSLWMQIVRHEIAIERQQHKKKKRFASKNLLKKEERKENKN